MNIEEAIKIIKQEPDFSLNYYNRENAIDVLLTAYEKEKEKKEELIKERATEIVYVDRNFIRKDRIKPIQIIDLDGKIHNVYKLKEE